MVAATMKQEASQIISQLPDDATWDDFDRARIRRSLDAGLQAFEEGRFVSYEALEAELNLD